MDGAVVYLLRCADGSLYCGSTTDLERRMREHGTPRGARYTRSRAPVELAASWAQPTLTAARSVEARIKQLSRAEKLALVAGEREPPVHRVDTAG